MKTLRSAWSPPAVAATLFAGATAAAAFAGFLQLAAPSEHGPALPLADARLSRAERLLAGAPTPAGLDAAEREVRAALKLSPARTEAWLQLAYLERLRAGDWSPAVAAALAESYRVGPLDPDAGLWRARFALEHWDRLSPELRRAALAEVDAVWTRGPMRAPIRTMAEEIQNPAGRLALAVELKRLRLQAAR